MVLNRDLLAKAAAAPSSAVKDEIFKAFEGSHDQIVARLKASPTAGPVVTEIIALIKQGMTNLPALLAALTASGVALPSWVTLVATILLPLLTETPTPAPAT